jgi:transcriptional regulator with XRE-family HTH domain
MLDNVGTILRRLRERRKMPQTALAAKAGFDHSSVSRWESGASSPSVERFNRMLQVMGVSFTELMGEIAKEQGLENPAFRAGVPTHPVELIASQVFLATEEGRDVIEFLDGIVSAAGSFRRAFLWKERFTAHRAAKTPQGAVAAEPAEEDAADDPAGAGEPGLMRGEDADQRD